MSNEQFDFTEFATAIDDVREAMRAMVAGLMSDGFTEEQAREMVAGMWRMAGRKDKGGESG